MRFPYETCWPVVAATQSKSELWNKLIYRFDFFMYPWQLHARATQFSNRFISPTASSVPTTRCRRFSMEYKHKRKLKYVPLCIFGWWACMQTLYIEENRDAIVMTSLKNAHCTRLLWLLLLLLKTMWNWLRASVIYTRNAVAVCRALSFSFGKHGVCACFYVCLYGTNATVLKIHLMRLDVSMRLWNHQPFCSLCIECGAKWKKISI